MNESPTQAEVDAVLATMDPQFMERLAEEQAAVSEQRRRERAYERVAKEAFEVHCYEELAPLFGNLLRFCAAVAFVVALYSWFWSGL